MSDTTKILFQTSIHVKEVLDNHCEPGSRNAFIESCLFLDPEFRKVAKRLGVMGPVRRNKVGNPQFGKGFAGRWGPRDENEATFHELEG